MYLLQLLQNLCMPLMSIIIGVVTIKKASYYKLLQLLHITLIIRYTLMKLLQKTKQVTTFEKQYSKRI